MVIHKCVNTHGNLIIIDIFEPLCSARVANTQTTHTYHDAGTVHTTAETRKRVSQSLDIIQNITTITSNEQTNNPHEHLHFATRLTYKNNGALGKQCVVDLHNPSRHATLAKYTSKASSAEGLPRPGGPGMAPQRAPAITSSTSRIKRSEYTTFALSQRVV
jgi:hypothetical protein